MKRISQILFVKMLEHQLASENKFGQVDFRSHLPEWQVEILTKVTPCHQCNNFVRFYDCEYGHSSKSSNCRVKLLWGIYLF